MPILETDGASIYYETLGDKGDWITLVNGHTRSSSDFRMMARVLTEDGTLRVLLLDNRASGKSEATRPFTIKDMCHDVVALWDHLSIPKSHVLGISMGGVIALGLAIEFCARVSRLILVSSAPEESFINRTGGDWVAEGSLLEDKMRAYFAPAFLERNPVLFTAMIQQIRQAIVSGKFTKNSQMQRNALVGVSWTGQLQTIKAPTLVIHGELDAVIDHEAATMMVDKIPNSRVTIIPGAGHLLLAEAPKELYKSVKEFLK